MTQKEKKKPQTSGKSDGPHPIDIHVGSRVRLRRLMLGMSQDKLGEALGLTFQQVQKYEKGINRIGASRIFRLSEILGVPIQFFYDDYQTVAPAAGMAEAEPNDAFMDLLSSPEGVQLCRHFSAIKDPTVKKKVLELVRSIADNEREDAGVG